jgi:hypothetical protein
MTEAGQVAFAAFCERYSPVVPNFDYKPEQLSTEQREPWELWMTRVFHQFLLRSSRLNPVQVSRALTDDVEIMTLLPDSYILEGMNELLV